MMPRLAGMLTLLIAFSPQARIDQARPSTGSGVISGVVVTDGPSPQPVPRARVTLDGSVRLDNGSGPGASVRYGMLGAVLTDDRGRFTFSALAPGVYTVDAVKPPLVPVQFGPPGVRQQRTTITLTDTEPLANLTITMIRGAAITGTVRDQDGQPIQGASVTASPAGADVQEAAIKPATTDDLGRYRLSGLAPGEFLVGATIGGTTGTTTDSIRAMQPGEVQRTIQEARAGATTAADSTRIDRGTTVIWGRVYYPGTADRTAAGSVSVASGDERAGIDIQLQLVTANRIEGTVTMPYGAPAQNVRVTVRPVGAGETGSPTADDKFTARTDVAGHYAIAGIVPGTYELQALNASASPSSGQITVRSVSRTELELSDPPMWATAQAMIAGQDVTIPLVLQRGVNISGQVLFEGVEPSVLEVYRQRVSIRNSASTITPPPIQIEPTGKFQLVGVIPGKYEVSYGGSSTGRAWSLKTATADGADVLEAPMEVRAGRDIRALTLTLTDRPSRLTGTVSGITNPMTGRFSVAVFPVERARWTSPIRVRNAAVGTDNNFAFANLPDGDYFVAVAPDLGRDWNSAATLERLTTAAARVTIASRKTVVCDLRAGG